MIYYQNVRGLNTKTNILYNASLIDHFKVIAFTKTCLNSTINSCELFNLSLYNVFRGDRKYHLLNKQRGGGVMLAVDKSYRAVQLEVPNVPDIIDLLCVKVFLSSRFIYVIVLYIPPGINVEEYDALVDSIMSLECLYNNRIVILGDFNIPEIGISKASHAVQILEKLFTLEQSNHIVNINGRILDLIFHNFTRCIVTRANDPVLQEDNHHPPLLIDLSIKHNTHTLTYRSKGGFNFKKANFSQLYDEIFRYDWSMIHNSSDPSDALNLFYEHLNMLFEKSVPKKKSIKTSYPVWFTLGIIKNIKLR